MFHIVANRNWRRGRCPAVLPGAAGVRGVRPGHLACRGGPRVPPASNNLLQSLSPTRDAGGGARRRGRNAGRWESLLPRRTKVGNYEFYFHVILFTWDLHYTRCECTLYLFVVRGPVAERERRESPFFALCRSLTWEELG